MPTLDRISPLIDHFRVRTRLFNAGRVCGVTSYAPRPGQGFIHVLRDGHMTAVHRGPDGRTESIEVDKPSVLLYPRPVDHTFHADGEIDLVCAAVDFDGGEDHPLVRTLPPVVVMDLAEIESLDMTLMLLFSEVDRVRCGHRVLADRLLEVVLIQMYRWMLDHPKDLDLPPGLLIGLSDPQLSRALIAMHAHPDHPWTLTSLARESALSRSSFAARFRSRVGQTPMGYLSGWRITVAQQRLRSGDSVGRTAASLNYSSSTAFSRAFSKQVGCSPRAWLSEVSTDSADVI